MPYIWYMPYSVLPFIKEEVIFTKLSSYVSLVTKVRCNLCLGKIFKFFYFLNSTDSWKSKGRWEIIRTRETLACHLLVLTHRTGQMLFLVLCLFNQQFLGCRILEACDPMPPSTVTDTSEGSKTVDSLGLDSNMPLLGVVLCTGTGSQWRVWGR